MGAGGSSPSQLGVLPCLCHHSGCSFFDAVLCSNQALRGMRKLAKATVAPSGMPVHPHSELLPMHLLSAPRSETARLEPATSAARAPGKRTAFEGRFKPPHLATTPTKPSRRCQSWPPPVATRTCQEEKRDVTNSQTAKSLKHLPCLLATAAHAPKPGRAQGPPKPLFLQGRRRSNH